MIKEIITEDKESIAASLIESIYGNRYLMMTVLFQEDAFISTRFLEQLICVSPPVNEDGRYQSMLFKALDDKDEANLKELLSIRRYLSEEEAREGHISFCEEMEQENYDYMLDPYYLHKKNLKNKRQKKAY